MIKKKTKPVNTSGRRIRLKTAKDCARFIARQIKKVEERGESVANIAYKQVCMTTMLVKALEVSDIEQRLEQIEKIQIKNGNEAFNE